MNNQSQDNSDLHSRRYTFVKARDVNGDAVITKSILSTHPTRIEIAALQHEFQILKSLEGIEGIPRAQALIKSGNGLSIVLDDFGGTALSQVASLHAAEPLAVLDIAKRLASILAQMHDRGVIHCDLKPGNILVRPSDHAVQIIDFEFSRQLTGRGQFQNEAVGYTLAYISPEQTGRVNRRVDHRTDLYSLGVTLYELISGEVPFKETNVLSLVHAHIAKKPVALKNRDEKVPRALSLIVEKLLQKSPESRYQTARGLLHDLQVTEKNLKDGNAETVFELGLRDQPENFRLSQKIYGRETELSFLKLAYARSASGLVQVDISGEKGIGKTSLLREFLASIVDSNSILGQGKAPLDGRESPYSAVRSTFSDLVEQMKRGNVERLREFSEVLVAKLGRNLGALEPIIPNLDSIVENLPRPEAASDVEGRLRSALLTFMLSASQIYGRIVLFIDDYQFADLQSRQILHWFGSQTEVAGILLLKSVGTQDDADLRLAKLNVFDIKALVLDSFGSVDEATALVNELFSISSGNPLVIGQVLASWVEHKILEDQGHGRWQFVKSRIKETKFSTDFLTQLTERAKLLSPQERNLLSIASCFPNTFSIDDLAAESALEPDAVFSRIQQPLKLGFIVLETAGRYRFPHGQLKEIFKSEIAAESLRVIKLSIAVKTLTDAKEVVSSAELYALANYVNEVVDGLRSDVDLKESARLNLRVSGLASMIGEFGLSLQYVDYGILSVSRVASKENESAELLFELSFRKAETLFVLGRVNEAEALFKELRKLAPNKNELIKVETLEITLLSNSGRSKEALQLAVGALNSHGLKISRSVSKIKLLALILRTYFKTSSRSLAKLHEVDLSKKGAAFAVERQKLLVAAVHASYFQDKGVFAQLILNGCLMSFREGATGDILPTFLQTALGHAKLFGNFNRAERICAEVIDPRTQQVTQRAQNIADFARAAFLRVWIQPWKPRVSALREVFDRSEKSGDPQAAGYAALYYSYNEFYLGESLSPNENTERFKSYLAATDPVLYLSLLPLYGLKAALRGETASLDQFTHADLDEDKHVANLASSPTPNPRSWYAAHKLMACAFSGNHDLGEKYIEAARDGLEHYPFALTTLFTQFFISLNKIDRALAKGDLPKSDRREIAEALKYFKKRSALNSQDASVFSELLEAEWSALRKQRSSALSLFESAQAQARSSESWMMIAFTDERAARFHARDGRARMAKSIARDAAYEYERWGAVGKAEALRREFDLDQFTPKPASRSDSRASSSASSTARLSAIVDTESIIQASRALSAELNIDDLSAKLTTTMMECAGATSALLIHRNQGRFTIEATAGVSRGTFDADLVRACFDTKVTKFGEGGNDALESRLCLPIVSKDKCQYVIYLEHDSSSGVFAEDRVEILSALASQAAIAMENARLYSEVEEKARMTSELKTAQAVQKTLLPPANFSSEGISLSGYYAPASECGGDWWFYHANNGKTFIYIGDATGHGASAALITSAARSAVSLLSTEKDLAPAFAMSRLNHAIFETSRGSMNMTFFIAAFDPTTKTLTYSNASHDPPLVIRAGMNSGSLASDMKFSEFKNSLEELASVNGARLGESLNSKYTEASVTVHEGDLMALFSDGIYDAKNPTAQEWGQRRFLKALFAESLKLNSPEEKVNSIMSANSTFRDGTPLDDDIMLVVAEF